MSIVNGLFAGRAGIQSHGNAIAVIGDNISNSSTIGYKSARAEFEDLIAGGQTSGRTIGSGSSTSAVSMLFGQGTLEFTSRPLDLAVDGNGFFVVQEGLQRFYTRAGNFKVDPAGFIVDQKNAAVLGFPASGSGALQPLNINSISQSSVNTRNVEISGNVDAGSAIIAAAAIPATPTLGPPQTFANGASPTFTDLNNAADFSTVVDVFDSLGEKHTVTFFYYHTATNEWEVQGYVSNEEVETAPAVTGRPVAITGTRLTMEFANGDGVRTNPPAAGTADFPGLTFPWSNQSDQTAQVNFSMDPFTQYATSSNILAITQDGRGIGAVTSISIESNGDIFALLDNGQSSVIGTIGLVNFAAPEGLSRIGGNRLQQSVASGEPIVGQADSGTFGGIQAGSIELSTVDIASEFVKMITLQRGFQASSRIITTINQLLNEIIQLV